jgi:hypothetical protein
MNNTTLLWKENRRQRALWLTVFVTAAVLVVGLTATVESRDDVDDACNCCLMVLAAAYSVIVGALSMANEKEVSPLNYPDGLVSQRSAVWRRKLVVGAASSSQSLALAVLALASSAWSFENPVTLLAVGLNAMGWGVFAVSCCRTVRIAIPALMTASWGLLLFAISGPWIYFVEVALGLCAFYGSWRIYCHDGFARWLARLRPINRLISAVPLSWRQAVHRACWKGRWLLVAVGAGAVVGFSSSLPDQTIFWPLGSLLLGLVFGLGVFDPGGKVRKQFLAAQRYSLGRYWVNRTGFWLLIMCVAVVVAWYVGTALIPLLNVIGDPTRSTDELWDKLGDPTHWINKWTHRGFEGDYPDESNDPLLLIVIWPLYGFCFGQLFGMLINRAAIAVILATTSAAVSVALWAPSIYIGGVHAWQVFVVPAILLLTSRFAMRPWAERRLLERHPIVGFSFAAVLVTLSFFVAFWQRATEVPDVGEPFDVNGYVATLPPPEMNESGTLFCNSIAGLNDHVKRTAEKLGRPTDPDSLRIIKDLHMPDGAPVDRAYRWILGSILEQAWTANKDLDRWLNEVFKGEWVGEVLKAVKLPPGMVQDPRLVGISNWQDCGLTMTTSQSQFEGDCKLIASLFTARALQLQAHGDVRGALSQFDSSLALSRLLKSNVEWGVFDVGRWIERHTLFDFYTWLAKAGPDQELLRAGLDILQRHEAANPGLLNNIKAEYVSLNRPELQVFRKEMKWLELFPWEVERQDHIKRAIFAAQMRFATEPTYKTLERLADCSASSPGSKYRMRLAVKCGFPMVNGPAAGVDLRQWAELLNHFEYFATGNVWGLPQELAENQRLLNAGKIVTCVALYQVDHGMAPSQLGDLVANYLTSLPIDPLSGFPFQMRISQGEQIDYRPARVAVAPGQRIVFTEELIGFNWEMTLMGLNRAKFCVPVPVWVK